jgi:GDP-4-dehydro-6-deoxy-D-mannose reductase
VVPAFARQIARIAAGQQEPVVRVGDIEPRRDFLDVRDVCAAYIACLDVSESIAPGSIFNISSGRTIRIGDMLDALLAEANVKAEISPEPSRKRPTDIAHASGDSRKIMQLTGWMPVIAWSQTLRDVLHDWQDRQSRLEPAGARFS